MKPKFALFIILCLVIGIIVKGGISPAKDMHTQTIPDSTYKDALIWTDPKNFEVPALDSEGERQMLDALENLFTDYTYENLKENLTKVYAEKIYFRDAFRQFSDHRDLEEYMLAGLRSIHKAEFVFNQVIRKEDEFYVDWTMRLDFKSTPEGTWEESIGMSHFRFNERKEVIFHQDYWDPTDIVYRRIPVAKQLISYVKKKM